MDNSKAAELNKKNREEHFPKENLGEEYEFISYIGSGSYGHVCKAKQVSTGKIVAIKKFSHIFKNDTNTLRLLRELRILTALKDHPKIIRMLDIIPPRDLVHFNDLYIVMEFMDTDLSKIINSTQFLTTLHIQFILYQILVATKALHSAKIYHRDLKPQNILINEDCIVKICDFGLSRGAPSKKSPTETRKLTSHVVTRWYRAPEVIFLTNEYTSAIDIWSIGCIFAELLGMQKENTSFVKGRMPLFPGISCFPLSPRQGEQTQNSYFMDQISIILHVIGTPSKIEISDFKNCVAKNYLKALPHWPGIDIRKKFPGATELELDLLKKMLSFCPSKRPTVEETLNHPYLENIRDMKSEITVPSVEFEFEGKSMKKIGRGLLIREVMKNFKKQKLLRKNITFNLSKEEESPEKLSEESEEKSKRENGEQTEEKSLNGSATKHNEESVVNKDKKKSSKENQISNSRV